MIKSRFRVRHHLFKEPAQKAGFCFSSYGRFQVVATRYLFTGFHAIFADVLCC